MNKLEILDRSRYRYHSLAISSVWDLDKVRDARALVVGAGALGNEVAKNLAMMGVQQIIIIDRDTVEVANLTRSIFFREADHGRGKAEVIVERLREFNSDVETIAMEGALEEILGLGLLRQMDMIFSCLDNRLARRSLNRMCQKVGKPWVDGAMENLLGDVTVFLPDSGPCYECYLTPVDLKIIAQAKSCRGVASSNLSLGKVPTVSTMGSIIAALQVQEGLKILHDQFEPAHAGRRLVVNCLANDFYSTLGVRREDCPGHFRFGEIIELEAACPETTSAADLLRCFSEDTGDSGHLRLGRQIVTGVRCWTCQESEGLNSPLSSLRIDQARCPTCGEIREPETTHVVQGKNSYAKEPLKSLGIPAFDVLEVRGAEACRWYELGSPESDATFDTQPADRQDR